ncbi:MAG: sigma-70 family RNA polymerase sigma factor [Deltaproteobacteria bacterium]|nr:sigma-70 family RNA polymerase sigma factor [Deltaproteobacteria bacterium]
MRPSGTEADEALVLEAQKGSGAHFDALVDRYTPIVYRIALGITRNPFEAEEVVQETFLRAFKHLDQFSPSKATFRTWLLTITRNQSINLFKSLKRKAARFLLDHESGTAESEYAGDARSDQSQDAEHLLSTKQQYARVKKALARLPERQQTALMLKTQENMSYEEIASIMNTSVSSVESLLFRARKKLLELLED